MFRVPLDPDQPTFDDTFKVGFFRWLTSHEEVRREWVRRRIIAAEVARMRMAARLADRAWHVVRRNYVHALQTAIVQGRLTTEEAEARLRQLDGGRPPGGGL